MRLQCKGIASRRTDSRIDRWRRIEGRPVRCGVPGLCRLSAAGLIELAVQKNVLIGGDDFKSDL
jgi:hypothetical protein